MQRIRLHLNRLKLWLVNGGLWVNVLGYLGVLLLALSFQNWSGFQYAEWKLFDQSLKLLRRIDKRPALSDVVVVAADEASFSAFDEPFALWHKRLGGLIDAMVVAQPAVLGLDMALPAKSFDTIVPGIDRQLQLPLLRARGNLPLVVAQTLDDQLQPRAIFPGFVALIGPHNLASALVCFDEDSVVRRVMSARCGGEGAHLGLAERMAQHLGAPERGQGLIDYRIGAPFITVSMAEVLRWHAQGQEQKLRETFGAKPVLVGVVLPLEDRLRVPVALSAAEPNNTRVPGVMLHGQILRTLLNQGYIRALPGWWAPAMTALVCLLWFGKGFKLNLAYWTLFLLLPSLGLYSLWLGYSLAPAALLMSAQLAYVARQGLEAMRLSHQRKRLSQAFAGHVNPRLLQRVLASDQNQGGGELAPQRQDATAMWVQIPADMAQQGLTSPADSLQGLAGYYDAVQQAVQRVGGMVDRFQGTGVLAYFGAPLPQRYPARAALEAALTICRSHANWGTGLTGMGAALPQLSIGIASGPAITGQAPMRLASPFVFAGAVVAEAMQLARQAAADKLEVRVLVSDTVAAAVAQTGLQRVALVTDALAEGTANAAAGHAYAMAVP